MVHPTITAIFDDECCGVGIGEDVLAIEDESVVEEKAVVVDEGVL